MDRIKTITEELANAIINTDVFNDFVIAKEKINEEELKEIKSYKCLKAKLINEYSAETENEANLLYSNMMLNSHTREYIKSEKKLLGFVTDIYDDIGEKINEKVQLDVDFN